MENIVIKNETYKQRVKYILIIFMALQPILDMIMSLLGSNIEIVGVSAVTFFRFAVVFVLLCIVVFKEINKKSTKLFLIYAGIIAVYAIFHHINASTFSVKLAQADYNALGELMYLARMCVPIAILYLVYMLKPNYKDVKRVVVFSAFVISFVIIVTNLFKVGFIAYNVENTTIHGTMLDWFKGNPKGYEWYVLSCRGLFQSTNQMSGIVLMLCPLLTYICLVEKKIGYWCILAMHLVAMINLSTRIASIGGVAVFCGIVAIYIVEKIIHKQIDFKKVIKNNTVCFVACVILVSAVLAYSPISMRADKGGMFNDLIMNGQPPDNDSEEPPKDFVESELPEDPEERKQYMIDYIEANLYGAGIQDLYIKNSYPYTDDAEFWYNIIKYVPESERYGNRNMRGYLIDRIFERDDRVSNDLLGISYTRSSSFVWPERDIETHLDSLGIIGTFIFLGPYFLILIFGIINFFKKFKDSLYLKKVVYLITAGIGVLASYLSGHIMNEIFPALVLSFVCGLVINVVFEDMSSKNVDVVGEEK